MPTEKITNLGISIKNFFSGIFIHVIPIILAISLTQTLGAFLDNWFFINHSKQKVPIIEQK